MIMFSTGIYLVLIQEFATILLCDIGLDCGICVDLVTRRQTTTTPTHNPGILLCLIF